MRSRTVTLLAVCAAIEWLSSIVLAESPDAVDKALRFFETLPPAANSADTLRTMRPAPAGPAERARAREILPASGELQPDREDAGDRTRLPRPG
jgi:hypothetical protein